MALLKLILIFLVGHKMLLNESVSSVNLLALVSGVLHKNQLKDAFSLGNIVLFVLVWIAHGFKGLNYSLRVYWVLHRLNVTVNGLLSDNKTHSNVVLLLLSQVEHLSLVHIVLKSLSCSPILLQLIIHIRVLKGRKERMLQSVFGADTFVRIHLA